jgi:hypothetical protein
MIDNLNNSTTALQGELVGVENNFIREIIDVVIWEAIGPSTVKSVHPLTTPATLYSPSESDNSKPSAQAKAHGSGCCYFPETRQSSSLHSLL